MHDVAHHGDHVYIYARRNEHVDFHGFILLSRTPFNKSTWRQSIYIQLQKIRVIKLDLILHATFLLSFRISRDNGSRQPRLVIHHPLQMLELCAFFTPSVCFFSFRDFSMDDSYRFITIDGPWTFASLPVLSFISLVLIKSGVLVSYAPRLTPPIHAR